MAELELKVKTHWEAAMIMIVSALEIELLLVRWRLRWKWKGANHRRRAPVVFRAVGIGPEAVLARLPRLIEQARPKPELLINAGFAGGLRPGLESGELLLAERLLTEDGRELALDGELVGEAASALEAALEPEGKLHRGALVSVGAMARGTAERACLGRELPVPALAVEMEAFWVGEVARSLGVPFLAVKALIDPLERPLPPPVERVSRAGRLSPAAVLPLFAQPGELLRVARQAGLASGRLALALEALVECFNEGG